MREQKVVCSCTQILEHYRAEDNLLFFKCNNCTKEYRLEWWDDFQFEMEKGLECDTV